jgi:hypothetical protein
VKTCVLGVSRAAVRHRDHPDRTILQHHGDADPTDGRSQFNRSWQAMEGLRRVIIGGTSSMITGSPRVSLLNGAGAREAGAVRRRRIDRPNLDHELVALRDEDRAP